MENWAMDIENVVYSNVKNKVTSAISSKYPNLNFTQIQSNTTDTKFPNVYIHILSMNTRKDLEGYTVIGAEPTFQVDVTTNTSQQDVRYILDKIYSVFVSMGYSTNIQAYTKESDVYRGILRASRLYGGGDTLL